MGFDSLAELARHFTNKENDTNKVEQFVTKSAAAIPLIKILDIPTDLDYS